MRYEIELVNVSGERSDGQEKVYRFSISNGSAKTHANVTITYGGVKVIEQGGKDPKTAAKIALDRLLRDGRDPFKSKILVLIPYGHAQYFARYGNYNSLPVLTD